MRVLCCAVRVLCCVLYVCCVLEVCHVTVEGRALNHRYCLQCKIANKVAWDTQGWDLGGTRYWGGLLGDFCNLPILDTPEPSQLVRYA